MRRLLTMGPALAAALSAALPRQAWAQSGVAWPRDSAVPGGVAHVPLGPAGQRPQAFADAAPLLVLGDPSGWTALVGIPLSAEPGTARIRVRGEGAEGGGEREMAYTVRAKRYTEQHLKVSPRTVDLSPEDLARHERERAHQQAVIATFSAPPSVPLQMRQPTPGRRSSSFGLRRFFNGQARSPQPGCRAQCVTRVVPPEDSRRTRSPGRNRPVQLLSEVSPFIR